MNGSCERRLATSPSRARGEVTRPGVRGAKRADFMYPVLPDALRPPDAGSRRMEELAS